MKLNMLTVYTQDRDAFWIMHCSEIRLLAEVGRKECPLDIETCMSCSGLSSYRGNIRSQTIGVEGVSPILCNRSVIEVV